MNRPHVPSRIRPMQHLQRAAAYLILLYAVLTVGYMIGHLVIGERWVLIEIGNSLMPAILLPVFVFIPLALLIRRWRLAILCVPALALFFGLYSPLFLPRQPVTGQGIASVRLLTWNVGSQTDQAERAAALIRAANAEIVTLQELQPAFASALAAELADLYPYQALYPVDTYALGIGLFSQYLILDDAPLESLALGGQRTRIAYSRSQQITLFNVHPISPRILGGFDSTRRQSEIDALLELAAIEDNPTLLLGDFNITDQTDDYARIAAQYGDAFQRVGSGLGLSFPNLSSLAIPLTLVPPILRIDYVFFDTGWTAVQATVLPDASGSDHYPLYAEMQIESARSQ